MKRVILGLASLMIVLSLALAACAKGTENPTTAAPAATLTIYSGREEALVKPIIDQFQQTTGIKIAVKYGGSAALALTIQEEGKNSPADIFFAQDPGDLGSISGLLARLPDSLLSKVPSAYRSPEGKWVGISGRARVIVYNTQKVKPEDLPASLSGFTDQKWKGRIGWAPTNGSFQAMVTAMRVMWGEQRTREWLQGIQANNPKTYTNNTGIVAAVGSGEVEVGFVNHYYLYRFLQERGESFPARNHYLKGDEPGAVVLVAGAGILSTSKNSDAAQRFLEFMLSTVSQQYFASKTFEYPLIEGVQTHRELLPLSQLQPPQLDVSQLSDVKGTLNLLRDTGVIP